MLYANCFIYYVHCYCISRNLIATKFRCTLHNNATNGHNITLTIEYDWYMYWYFSNLLTFIPDKQFRFLINAGIGGENYIVFVTPGIVEMLNSSGRYIELVIISSDVILNICLCFKLIYQVQWISYFCQKFYLISKHAIYNT